MFSLIGGAKNRKPEHSPHRFRSGICQVGNKGYVISPDSYSGVAKIEDMNPDIPDLYQELRKMEKQKLQKTLKMRIISLVFVVLLVNVVFSPVVTVQSIEKSIAKTPIESLFKL